MSDATDRDDVTIDALARETGVTVRTIRAYQSRGLLPPPAVRARTGYYTREHVARLELIRELQADGFNLRSIKRLIEQGPGSSEELLDFRHALRAPFEREQPIVMTADELAESFGGERDDKGFARAEKLGLLVPLGEDRYEVTSPSIIRAGARTMALGVPLEANLEVLERVARHAEGAAEAFVRLYLEHIWRAVEKDNSPERWTLLQQALEELRPLAAEVLLALFEPTMSRAVEGAFQRQMRRERKRG